MDGSLPVAYLAAIRDAFQREADRAWVGDAGMAAYPSPTAVTGGNVPLLSVPSMPKPNRAQRRARRSK